MIAWKPCPTLIRKHVSLALTLSDPYFTHIHHDILIGC